MTVSIPSSTLEKFTTFGDLLRFLRRRMGITQTELAIAVGYSHTQISRLEQNLRLPDIPTIEARFVSALGLEQESKAVTRLLDLAANVRREDAPALGLCPYKGLNYFDEADADLFVGREALTSKLVERVLSLTLRQAQGKPLSESPYETRFLAVIGASGSGKSSLVRAGLIPALRWNKASADWHIHILTPTTHPLESLAGTVVQESNSVTAIANLMDDLASDPRSLQIFAKRKLNLENNIRLLLVVDQFEELFALCRSEEQRVSFISNLLAAASETDGPISIVITLRADFYAYCANYTHLREALAHNQEYIGAMNEEELQRAIEEPAQRGRWEFESGLVDLLLHEVGHEPGALPLLSHALLETWQRRRGRTMTLSGYASSGGVRGAIAETAETVFTDQFTREQQVIARRILLRLTEISDENSLADTRRRASFNELILKPEEAVTTHAVLKALADARLITTSQDSAEVAHEALIREWPTLRGWLEENREGLRLHRQLTEAAQEWLEADRSQESLYRGARLSQARDWASTHQEEMNDLEREFIAVSVRFSQEEAAEREAQRLRELEGAQKLAQTEKARADENIQSAQSLRIRNRVITTIGAIALVLAVLAGLFSVQSNQNATQGQSNLASAQTAQALSQISSSAAQTAQAVAEMNFVRAESLRLSAEADAILAQNGDPEVAALLGIRALQSSYSIRAYVALIVSLEHLYNLQLFSGHTKEIYAVAFSPDGKYILTASRDGSARLWDAQNGQEVRRLAGHMGGISSAAFSPDGKSILTGGNDQTARLWNAQTGEQLRVFNSFSYGISSIAFSPDGKYILTDNGDKVAFLWDAKTGQIVQDFVGHTYDVSDVAFSPDGQYVLTGSVDTTARIWETATGKELQIFTGRTRDSRMTSVAFSPDGKYVLTGNDDWTAQLWDVETGQEIRTFSGHTNSVKDVTFSPDGQYIVTGSFDKTVRLWETQNGQEIRRFIGHQASVKAVGFSPDGKYVLSGAYDKTARLWAALANPSPRVFAGHSLSVTSVTFSPDSKYALTGGEDTAARLWDVASGREIRTFIGHTKAINSVAFSPDGIYVLTGSDDNTARLWRAETAQEIYTLVGESTRGVINVAFSPDNQYALTLGVGYSSSGQTLLWDVKSGQMVRDFNVGPPTNDLGPVVAFSPDSNYVLHGPNLSDVETGNIIKRFDTFAVRSLALSADGKYVLTGDFYQDKTVRLWDFATGQEVRTFIKQIAKVRSVAFSPDGKYALAGLDNHIAYLWDVATGQELRQFVGHSGPVNSVAFSPDGKYVLTGSNDGTARLWDTDYHDTIQFACSLLLRDFTQDERIRYAISDNAPTCPTKP